MTDNALTDQVALIDFYILALTRMGYNLLFGVLQTSETNLQHQLEEYIVPHPPRWGDCLKLW